jgi:hypothetical protein
MTPSLRTTRQDQQKYFQCDEIGAQQPPARKHSFAVLAELGAKSTTPSFQVMLAANAQPVSVQACSTGFVKRSQQFANSHPRLCKEITRHFRREGRRVHFIRGDLSFRYLCDRSHRHHLHRVLNRHITWSSSDLSAMYRAVTQYPGRHCVSDIID